MASATILFGKQRTELGFPLVFFLLCLCFSSCATTMPKRSEPAACFPSTPALQLKSERPFSHASTQADSYLIDALTPVNLGDEALYSELFNKEHPIPIPDRPAIRKYIRFYKGKGRTTFLRALERSWSYVPVMTEILEAQGVPGELIFIVLVESRFKGKAVSPGGAGGYWQLLPSTARMLGLRVDRWVDERFDAIKSTAAAAKYLRSLFDKYRSWELALAAYNSGDLRVLRAIKACGSNDYWEMRKRGLLPKVTRAYVPKVFAAIKMARDLEADRFESAGNFPAIHFESAYVKAPLKLQEIAKWTEVPVKHLRSLNPSLKRDKLPPKKGFALRLPPGTKEKFLLAYENYLQH